MDDLLKSILEGVYIRGRVRYDKTLLLNFLTGWIFKSGTTTEGEPMVFLIECILEDSGDYYGFYGSKPQLTLKECKPGLRYLDVVEPWDKQGWMLDRLTTFHIYKDGIPKITYPSNHPSILQTLSCLYIHLSSVEVPDNAMAVEIYAHLAYRIEAFIKAKNRKYLNTMEMDAFR